MKNLVIVESPAKVKTIKKYLGPDYEVKASLGHIIDLPKSDLGIDIEKKFKPSYEVTKRKVLKGLKESLAHADKLIIATDPDREGEAIGWHIAQKLGVISERGSKKSKDKDFERIVFTSITKGAVQDAIKNPRGIDMNLVDAQQARRVLDRLVGYKLSPLLWKKIRYGLSAGRVQSVAVKFIVDREEERERFKKEEFWNIYADLSERKVQRQDDLIIKDEEDHEADFKGIKFELLKKDEKTLKVSKESEVKKILSELLDKWIISKIVKKDSQRNSKPPFTTSTLQQTAANKFGYSSKKTMMLAQKLYEAGYITYMRTDSTNIVPEQINNIRNFIGKEFGSNYLTSTAINFATKSKVAQEAHEAIRPTNISATSSKLGLEAESAKIYDLIRGRTLATQMQPARFKVIEASIDNSGYLFQAKGMTLEFEGYLKAYPENFKEMILPDLSEGDELNLIKILSLQKFTQPPARYTEATLIKEMEKHGVGRPSTYAPTISTILSRKYVEKDGKYFFPTDVGRVVNKLLVQYFKEVVDTDFTANLENNLDSIADGKSEWVKVIEDFYSEFEKDLAKGDKQIDKNDFTVLGEAPKDIKCPVCGSPMQIKLSKYGKFYSCSRFPECTGMRNLDGRTEEQTASEMKEKALSQGFLSKYQPAPKTEDGKDYLLKNGRFGEFWAHPDYPKKKDIQPLVLQRSYMIELYGEPPQTKDGRDYLLKKGRFGEFWAHPDYPKEKDIVKVKKLRDLEA